MEDRDRHINRNTVRIGILSARRVDGNSMWGRVTYPEKGNMVSGWMQIMQRNTVNQKDFNMPEEGECVVCLHLPTGLEHGVILGSIYTRNNPPPIQDKTKRRVVFQDGSSVEMDYGTGALTVVTSKNVVVQAGQDVNVTASGNLNANVSGTATVQAASIQLKGPVTITGNLTVNGNTTLNGTNNANPRISNVDGSGGGS